MKYPRLKMNISRGTRQKRSPESTARSCIQWLQSRHEITHECRLNKVSLRLATGRIFILRTSANPEPPAIMFGATSSQMRLGTDWKTNCVFSAIQNFSYSRNWKGLAESSRRFNVHDQDISLAKQRHSKTKF